MSALLGGGELQPDWRFIALTLAAIIAIALLVAERAHAELIRLPRATGIVLGLLTVSPLLQLIPLPPALWHALPGREIEMQILALVGQEQSWRPISMAPLDTAFAQFYLLFPIAVFLGVLRIPASDYPKLFMTIGVLALLNLGIGLLQLATGGNLPDFYSSSHRGHLLGLFANRNHTALYFALALPAALVLIGRIDRQAPRMAWTAIVIFLALAAAMATASRAGTLLVIFAALGGALVMPTLRPRQAWPVALLVLCMLGGALAAITGFGRISRLMNRFGDVPLDLRWEIYAQSWVLAKLYFPFGSGLGTFVPVYEMHETRAMLRPLFINHAHNDYLELLVEYGLAGGIAILAFLVLLVRGIIRQWNRSQAALPPPIGASALILATILLHSLVDYPLRRMAIAAIFSTALAIVLSPPGGQRGKSVEARSGRFDERQKIDS